MQIKFLYILILFVSNSILAQDSLELRFIDSLIEQKAKRISPIPAIRINADGFGLGESYGEMFLVDSISKELFEVEYSRINPYVNITYYFDKNELIKVIAIDKSTSTTFRVISYFKNNKMIYISRKPADGDNGGTFLLNKSKEYLNRYSEYQKTRN
jgi:hypothetical protein